MLSADLFERAGIRVSPEEFERMVIAAIELVAPRHETSPGRDLTDDQLAALRRGGIDPTRPSSDSTGPEGPAARGAALYTAILATSLTIPEAAMLLGVDESRVRQRIYARSLYAIKPETAWRVPRFQFDGRRLVPGISRVLPHLDPGLSPLTVVAWFQRPSPNLVSTDGGAHSPLSWLQQGYPLAPVVEAAEALGRDG